MNSLAFPTKDGQRVTSSTPGAQSSPSSRFLGVLGRFQENKFSVGALLLLQMAWLRRPTEKSWLFEGEGVVLQKIYLIQIFLKPPKTPKGKEFGALALPEVYILGQKICDIYRD